MDKVIYLDNNSTTQVDQKVIDAMLPFLTNEYGNPNSQHLVGLVAKEAVDKARHEVANLIGASTNEIVFTSGATEAINLALKGVAESYSTKGNHIITVSTEHSAVLDTCNYLTAKGYEVTYLPVKYDGLIDLSVLKSALRDDTILVSVMIVNNETGVIQPLREIGKIVHGSGALFFTDATQAVGKMQINVDDFEVDLLCFSGHKFYAPKGVGALYVRQQSNRVKLKPILHGGGHERGLRSGTLNVPGVVALGSACSIAQGEMSKNFKKIVQLRDYLEAELLKLEGTIVNGNLENRLYNTTNILFRGADSDAIIMGLSNPDNNLPLIAVSNGSACTSASIDPSHVLTAMGLNENEAFSCIRFSLSKFTTKEEIDVVIGAVKNVVSGLREMIN
jgi:cysteine desulfurase